MAISINELRVNNIVLSPKNGNKRRCIIRKIHGNNVVVDYLNMQNGKMETLGLNANELEPISLMESTLCELGFKKATNGVGHPYNVCYVLKRENHCDITIVKTSKWHLLIHDYNGESLDKHEIYLHTLQNLLSHDKNTADKVSYNKFVKLSKPYCISPYTPKK